MNDKVIPRIITPDNTIAIPETKIILPPALQAEKDKDEADRKEAMAHIGKEYNKCKKKGWTERRIKRHLFNKFKIIIEDDTKEEKK